MGMIVLTTRAVCTLLGISRSTLYRLVARGVLTPLPRQHPVLRKEPRRWDAAAVRALLPPES